MDMAGVPTRGPVGRMESSWGTALNPSDSVYLPVYGPRGLIGVLHFAGRDFEGDTIYRVLGTLLQEMSEEFCAHA